MCRGIILYNDDNYPFFAMNGKERIVDHFEMQRVRWNWNRNRSMIGEPTARVA